MSRVQLTYTRYIYYLWSFKFLPSPVSLSYHYCRVTGHSLAHPLHREHVIDNAAYISAREQFRSHRVSEKRNQSTAVRELNRPLHLSGFYSWRNPDVGSWFIQALCKELELHGRSRDLLSLMTFVNRRVAIEYQSYVPKNEKFHAKKQIPSIVSMLTRLVYFPDKHTSSTDDTHGESREKEAVVSKKVT